MLAVDGEGAAADVDVDDTEEEGEGGSRFTRLDERVPGVGVGDVAVDVAAEVFNVCRRSSSLSSEYTSDPFEATASSVATDCGRLMDDRFFR